MKYVMLIIILGGLMTGCNTSITGNVVKSGADWCVAGTFDQTAFGKAKLFGVRPIIIHGDEYETCYQQVSKDDQVVYERWFTADESASVMMTRDGEGNTIRIEHWTTQGKKCVGTFMNGKADEPVCS